MRTVIAGSNGLLLEKTEDKQKFRVKDNVKVYMYTSAAPCNVLCSIYDVTSIYSTGGDSAIFPTESTSDLEPECKKRKMESDVHRTGAKCAAGEEQDLRMPGAQYHVVGSLRTKPGRGPRSISMSCSDKIARWCILGLQGALLSRLLTSPVYLDAIFVAKWAQYWRRCLK